MEVKQGVAEISEADVELYDRQIRIWGLEAQRRLTQTKVVISGESGIAAEVSKNLVLAGIGSLHCIVLENAKRRRRLGNFMPNPSSHPEAYRAAIADLNPRVNVTIHACSSLSEYRTTLIKSVDEADCVVLAGDETLSICLDVNSATREACSEKNRLVRFFMAKSAGLSAMFFSDMFRYEYVLKQQTGQSIDQANVANSGDLAPSVAEYCDLQAVLDLSKEEFDSLRSRGLASRLSKRASANFLSFLYLLKIHDVPGRKDHQKVLDEIVEQFGVKMEFEGVQRQEKLWNQELPSLASVMGGLLAQEIMKSVTRDSKPLKNWVLFDGTTTEALVLDLTAS
eukprot:TRINITY_DN4517_c0_g1_i1.p2 TRINITY_DN4517_c0_g1~~TRINITY_DN4517_c0_g1_i1.p2  ORF type:complete len:339 (+),score=83.58 TRINITY_DN4517_c0_g1_i1:95-1111(+)